MSKITTHPDYMLAIDEWTKYRYIKEGGDNFVTKYLVKFSEREDSTDFNDRASITPVPGFASAALTDVKNAIYQRMSDITRVDGSDSFLQTVAGKNGGVDLKGASMNHFIGRDVLPELLFMGKVGVYVDMPELTGTETKKDVKNKHPYVYIYNAEEIVNWVYTQNAEGDDFERLVLAETYNTFDEMGLPLETKKRYRFMSKENGVVLVRYYNEPGEQIDENGEKSDMSIELKINRIPFIIFELDRSLLKDVANHQIALLNLESSDISYTLKANFPFYTEQYSGKFPGTHLKSNEDNSDGENKEIEVGSIQGRRYTKGMDRPGFIHPPSEPLVASIDKQDHLKEDIRSLINLALSSIRPKFASAEAKQFDERGLESGLSFLGLVLEHGEQQIADFFAEYESDSNIATINYPERYGLKTDLQRMAEAEKLSDLAAIVPSRKYQKRMAKEIVRVLLGSKVSNEDLTIMLKEIENAKYMTGDAEAISTDLEKGLVSLETAATARGYDTNEPAKAEKDHAARLKRINDSQSPGARGDADNDTDPGNSAKVEKEITQNPDKKE